jgi:Tfp pilus assembly protein PilV
LVRSSTSRHADETGSSLVEVSVVVLALAVVPLAGMLEAGLRAATSSGEYDAARALANEKLEESRALPYSRPGGAADSAVERYALPGPPDATEGDLAVFARTAFVDENSSGPAD